MHTPLIASSDARGRAAHRTEQHVTHIAFVLFSPVDRPAVELLGVYCVLRVLLCSVKLALTHAVRGGLASVHANWRCGDGGGGGGAE